MAFKTILKISFHFLLWLLIAVCSLFYSTGIYLFYQAKGQLIILTQTQSVEDFKKGGGLSSSQLENLNLIQQIKSYSVDSLDFKPTKNFRKVYDQKKHPILWVVSASEKYKIQPYYWSFPIVGKVSYKGFFDNNKAVKEQIRLQSLGYDVDLRSVSAWSTLGWFSDPILSGMLDKSKGQLCNLIFHELFHATYYANSSVSFNENLASFIAHKATLNFLRNDSIELSKYLDRYYSNIMVDEQIAKEMEGLNSFYDSISAFSVSQKSILKTKRFIQICNKLDNLKIHNKKKMESLKSHILIGKNAWFVDYEQYNGLQDSLEMVFNKNYKSNLRKMVQSLK